MALTRNASVRRNSIWRAMLPPRPAIRVNHLIEGIRVAVACTAPVIAGELLHQPLLAWAGIAAFWICLADPGGPLRARFAAMAALTVAGTLTVAVAIWAVATNMWLALALCFIWTFACGFVAIYGGAAGGVGRLVSVVYLVVIGSFPDGLADLGPAVGDYAIGCLWAMFLVLVLWRTHPFQPGRIALSASYDALAIFAEDTARLVRQDDAPVPSAQATTATRAASTSSWDINATEHRSRVRREIEATRQIVAVLGRARPGLRPTLERQLLLAEYADRHFAALIAFSDLLESRLMQSGLQSPALVIAARPVLAAPLACLAALFRYLADVIPHDRQGISPQRRAELAAINAQLIEKTRLAHELLQRHAAKGDSSLPIFEHLLDTLLTCAEGVQGVLLDTQFAASGMPLPAPRQKTGLGSRLAGLAAEARDNLSWNSVSFRHALRVGVTVTVALYLTLAFQFGHGYWLTMTTVLILQPYVGSTWQTALQRMAGSVAGAVLAAFLVTVITDPLMTSVAVFPLSIGTSMFRALDYGLYTFFLTPQFVLIAGLANPEQADASLAGLRALDSVLGGVLALAASFLLWPNREARQLPLQVAKAITANQAYLQQVAMAKSRSPEQAPADIAAVDASRRQAGLGSNNAEAALQRWLGEPGHERLPVEAVMALITAARRLAGTATTLWLSPAAFPAQSQAEIRRRIDWVAEALVAIAEAVLHRLPPPVLSPAPLLAELDLGTATDGALLGNVLTRLYLQIEIMQEALQRLAAARGTSAG